MKDVFEKGTVEIKGSICPHSKNDQECFRGSRCYHDYHIDKEVLKGMRIYTEIAGNHEYEMICELFQCFW